MTTNTPKSGAARRQFLFDSAKMVCGVGMMGLGAAVITMFGTRVMPAGQAAPAVSAADTGTHLPPAS